MRFHVQTGGSTLTAQQPDVNVVRTTVQALAAVLGGAQSLHTNALDEALGLPTPASARLALRTQQVLYNESGVTATVDPLGGSYYVETLTDEIEERALAEIAAIDASRRHAGRPGRRLPAGRGSATRPTSSSVAVEAGERVIVGVNAFADEGEERAAGAAGRSTRSSRRARSSGRGRFGRAATPARPQEAVAALERAAAGTENVLPRIRACVEASVTLGEIANALRRVWGEHRP